MPSRIKPRRTQPSRTPKDKTVTIEQVAVLESHIDHLTGEELGHVFDSLHEQGALDVLWIPGVMKKNRPGGALRVVCHVADMDRIQAAFFAQTHTLGIRRMIMERAVLPREAAEIQTAAGTVAAKRYWLDGREFLRPEYEALASAARAEQGSLPHIRFAPMRAGGVRSVGARAALRTPARRGGGRPGS